MPPSKVGLSKLKRFYRSIQDKNDIQGMLGLNPQNLLLVRLGMGQSLHGYATIVETSYVNISEIERGKRKSISKPLMRRILSKSRPLPIFEEIEANYKKITSLSKGGQKQAMKRAEKADFTESEKLLSKKMKHIGVRFQSHQTLITSIGPVNVDFIVESKPKDIVIEISDTTRRQKLESMSYRALKIKQTYNNYKLVVILPDALTLVLKKRLEDFDVILKFSDIGNLEKKLQLAPQAAV